LPTGNLSRSVLTTLRSKATRRWTRLLDVLRNLQSSARRRRLRSRPWSAVAAISPSTRCVTHRLPFGPRGSPRNPNEPKITRSLARSLLSGPRSDRVHNTGVSFAEIIGQPRPAPKNHTRHDPSADWTANTSGRYVDMTRRQWRPLRLSYSQSATVNQLSQWEVGAKPRTAPGPAPSPL
jgi:hypothetical protein